LEQSSICNKKWVFETFENDCVVCDEEREGERDSFVLLFGSNKCALVKKKNSNNNFF
jgi:hypothetical protein